jgi:molybdate transport system regulatory protein
MIFSCRPDREMNNNIPTIRLHLWLENSRGVFFGLGRAQLLTKIDRYGSLQKAADDLGMSYRAAWGKIRRTEEVLGIKLITPGSSKREGCRLTEQGRAIMEKFNIWFELVEQEALKAAQKTLPWKVQDFPRDPDPYIPSTDKNRHS